MRKSLVALGAAGILAGCSSTPPQAPTIQSGPDAEITADGLYRVDNSVMPLAWMKPDMDLRPYTAIMIDPVEVAYQTDPQGRTRGGSVYQPTFPIWPSPGSTAELCDHVHNAPPPDCQVMNRSF